MIFINGQKIILKLIDINSNYYYYLYKYEFY